MSWDISKAFDSVSKDMIRLAWERVGVPPPIIEWLIALDEWAVAEWEKLGSEAFAPTSDDGKIHFFSPERGAGQGDTSNPATGLGARKLRPFPHH